MAVDEEDEMIIDEEEKTLENINSCGNFHQYNHRSFKDNILYYLIRHVLPHHNITSRHNLQCLQSSHTHEDPIALYTK